MNDRLEIIAHRGASFDAPENTLAAAELAWRQGADAVEADFWLTRDEQIVALHDDSTLRTTGKDLRIAEHTLAELHKLDAGRWKAERYAGQRIPTLGEMLSTMPPGKRFYVEIKCGPQIAAPLAAAIRAAGVSEAQIVLICFSAATLVAARDALPGAPAHLIVEFLRDPQTGVWHPDADVAIAEAVAARLDGLDLMAARALDAGLIERIRAARLDLSVWTVDSPAEARQFLQLGVRRITTNRPGWLRQELAGVADPAAAD